jgi:hypothetical protein
MTTTETPTEAPAKSMTVYVGISSDTRTTERYYLDVRDTTFPTQDPRGRQLRLMKSDTPAELVAKITAAGLAQGVLVEMVDETGGY